MIRFSHSIFAMPFALTAAVLALEGPLPWWALGWIVVAMISARSAAMGFNRLVDHHFDARNPRTAHRELPMGLLSRGEVWTFVLVSAAVFIFAASRLNTLCLVLSPVALLLVLGYSFSKRITALAQFFLGLSLSVAPVGAWLALRGAFSSEPLVLALAVIAWVSGFDIIYACQDVEVDRKEGLHSLPARLGIGPALILARWLHVLTTLLLLLLYRMTPLHPVYLVGVVLVAVLFLWQHSKVSERDMSRAMQAFGINAWVGVLYFGFTATARLIL
jgi:4-hydroxybenzoate polyprenyltransferase